jgi:predicted DNA-binding transcriptional regulator AlpA
MADVKELSPNDIVRLKDGERYFGFKGTQLKVKIMSGEIPRPIPLSDSGRALGWLGRQIIDHQRKLIAAAKKKTA